MAARLNSVQRELFHAAVRRVAPLSDSDVALLDDALCLRELTAGQTFLRAGDRAVDCGTLLNGILREYYPIEDGREVTRGFAGPGDSVGSLSDLLTSEPAASSVVAVTEAQVIVLPWATLRETATTNAAWSRFLAETTQRLYLLKAAREYELLALDAEARYARFRERFAALEESIPLRLVASYIGVTPEHLSRLRHRPA